MTAAKFKTIDFAYVNRWNEFHSDNIKGTNYLIYIVPLFQLHQLTFKTNPPLPLSP